ncbi:Hypothetical_protein [Hexamita inflata]|uniref:Hypothetical_protein n=1 Tax=Hexamita inflata TaxID=28002 RepID=A0AA86NZN8_9EUKA|nr:Hypothetical protein HINF_LOCUS17337 [Hexamita inflata]
MHAHSTKEQMQSGDIESVLKASPSINSMAYRIDLAFRDDKNYNIRWIFEAKVQYLINRTKEIQQDVKALNEELSTLCEDTDVITNENKVHKQNIELLQETIFKIQIDIKKLEEEINNKSVTESLKVIKDQNKHIIQLLTQPNQQFSSDIPQVELSKSINQTQKHGDVDRIT